MNSVLFSFNCLYWLKLSSCERDYTSLKVLLSYEHKNTKSVLKLLQFSLRIMATLRNKRKLAAVLSDTQEKARNGQSQNAFVPGMTGEYVTQLSVEIEGTVTKKLSQDFSWTESRILGALSKLDDLLNPQVRTFSGTVPGTSRKNHSENQEP